MSNEYPENIPLSRDRHGRVSSEWPDGARGCVISRELLDQMIEEANARCWISVEEQMPDRCLGYLVSTECYSDAAIIAYWNHDRRWMDGRKDITDSVTHWMPLPITPVEAEMMNPMSGQPGSQ